MESANQSASARIGRYELIRSLGRGSQGAVYLGRDPTLDRLVAIKVLAGAEAALHNTAADGAPMEARITGKLRHPNIVAIHDVGECELGPYLIFEYVEGRTLAEVVKEKGPFSITDAASLFASILDALATAHAIGIAHLDLSPRNVLLDSANTTRVMDFGLSQFTDVKRAPDAEVTGTVRYMAPEHFNNEELGPAADVFALGSTFYELVTGTHAMQGQSLEEIRTSIVNASADMKKLSAVPHGEAFCRFLAGALEPNRDGRYTDCSAMKEAFNLFLAESGLAASAEQQNAGHSTVEFLLRRMQRKKDFPAVSNTLAEINRLTSGESKASTERLLNVILPDQALTNKLLKLVNSAYYGARVTEVTSISEAVVFLGLEKVQMTANSLTLFRHLKGDSAQLKDSMTKSFLCGLIARHLAQRDRLSRAEEAFICGISQNLGENLVIYYFASEFDEIDALRQAKGLDKAAASRGVLGVSYCELGVAVAQVWNLPETIVAAIKGVGPGVVEEPTNDAEKLRGYAVFANELCDLFQNHPTSDVAEAMSALTKRFAAVVTLDDEYTFKLLNAAYEKLNEFSRIFEIDMRASNYCRSIEQWLNYAEEEGEPEWSPGTVA
ncbi:MAG: HDOD domain-containing protein [Betaproteobacteria bacterium]|nr:MAG: HDOD domain-containing protein [Betaproteobacteria bacterium]